VSGEGSRGQWRALVDTLMYEPSGSIKSWEFLGYSTNYFLLEKVSASWNQLCD
jgi:hypothetical protein